MLYNWNFKLQFLANVKITSNMLNGVVSSEQITFLTRNRKHRRAAAKPATCAKPLML